MLNRLIAILIVASIVLVAGLSGHSLAQTTSGSSALTAEVESLQRQIDGYVSKVEENAERDDQLIALASELKALQAQSITLGVSITERLSAIRTRLDQFGPAPAEGELAEPEGVAQERALLRTEQAELNLLIGNLEQSTIQANQLEDEIADVRRDLFTQNLSRRYDIGEAFGAQLFTDLSERTAALYRTVSSWANFTWRFKQSDFLGATFGAFLLALVSVYLQRRIFSRFVIRDAAIENPSYFMRLTTGFAYTIVPFIGVMVFMVAALGLYDLVGVLRADITLLLQAVVLCIVILVLFWRLAEALFSPSLPNWRILRVADHAAPSLKAIMIGMALIVVADLMITQANTMVGTSIPITVAKSLFGAVAVGLLFLLLAFIKPFRGNDDRTYLDNGKGGWHGLIKWSFVAIAVMLIGVALAGYIGFARYAANQIVTSGAVMITLLLGFGAARAISGEGALAQTATGASLRDRFGFSEARVDQLGLAAGFALGFVILAIGIPLIALIWGFDLPVVRGWLIWFFTDIQVGTLSISITGILVGIGLFFFGYWLTRRFQNWLDSSVLQRGRVELGARTSIRTAVGYVGVALAGIFGISAAGFDLSQLALVAGALSLGIGFGLQNIVSNFVSGLILLAERPFKSGDIIEAGGFTGIVEKVNVRATQITTFDQKTLILPNSELINSAVSNWMHRSTLGRTQVAVGVSYSCDPKQVRDLLMEIAEDHPRVLSNPEPFVSFEDFGASSLDFILFVHLADIGFGRDVRTELRLAIFERFKALGIEIPFPQSDVNMRVVRSRRAEKPAGAADEVEFDVIAASKSKSLDD